MGVYAYECKPSRPSIFYAGFSLFEGLFVDMTVPREIRNANVALLFVGEIYGTRLQISLTVTSHTCAQTYARTDPPTRALVNRWPRDCAPALSHPTRPKCPNMGSWNLGASGHRTIRGRPPLSSPPLGITYTQNWVSVLLSSPPHHPPTHSSHIGPFTPLSPHPIGMKVYVKRKSFSETCSSSASSVFGETMSVTTTQLLPTHDRESETEGADLKEATSGPYMAACVPHVATIGPQLATAGPRVAPLSPQLAASLPQVATSGPQLAKSVRSGRRLKTSGGGPRTPDTPDSGYSGLFLDSPGKNLCHIFLKKFTLSYTL